VPPIPPTKPKEVKPEPEYDLKLAASNEKIKPLSFIFAPAITPIINTSV
jgi:hypothetical protein